MLNHGLHYSYARGLGKEVQTGCRNHAVHRVDVGELFAPETRFYIGAELGTQLGIG
jgi:hypothetical protein